MHISQKDFKEVIMSYTEIVRVANNNNFNCTPEEFKQLDGFSQAYPNKYFFINSNIKTPLLSNINDHPYKAVITINPDLIVNPKYLERLSTVEPSKVAFIRVKWLPETPDHEELVNDLIEEGYDIVLTLQRFNSNKSLRRYTNLHHYEYSCSRYRLAGKALQYVEDFVDDKKSQGLSVHICDRKGQGCKGCRKCASYTLGKILPISSLNLSSSGICPYSCPDCYAKTLQNFLKKCEKRPIKYNVIKRNNKQAGYTKHIKNNASK